MKGEKDCEAQIAIARSYINSACDKIWIEGKEALNSYGEGWKAYDTLAFDYEKNTTSLMDTKSARILGGQYKITETFALRLGIAYGITPVQDGYMTPETPDANRINYTIGL
ncbi:hypothetical protein OSTOST_14355, partial [Ostertagia ostertagi]